MDRLQADVVIIGGGIMGSSAALHLRLLDRSVILLERGFVASQASGVNFGNVRESDRYLPQLPLARRSRDIWLRLGELIGDNCEYEPIGNLKGVYSEEELANLEEYTRQACAYGLEMEMIGSNALSERYPYIGKDIVGAAFTPNDGCANPRLVAPAFARAARSAGADICEFSEVDTVGHDGRTFLVTTKNGLEVRAEALLNSTGAWGDWIAKCFGEQAPIAPQGPQVGVTEPIPKFIDTVLSIRGGHVGLRQIDRGNVIFSGKPLGPASAATARARVPPQSTLGLRERLIRFVPALKNVHIIRTWSGVEGYLPDLIPIMGPSMTTEGLFHAFGFCGHGFQLGPAVGAVMAELIATGRTDTPIADFTIARFRESNPGTAGHGICRSRRQAGYAVRPR